MQKLDDIANKIQQELQDLCMCDITSDVIIINEAFFHCFDPSSYYVTYRARLSGTLDTDSRTIISYIEAWVSLGPSIPVQDALLMIDSECPVPVTSLEEGECSEAPVSSRDNTPVIIGSVVAAVLILAVLVIAIAVFIKVWKNRHETQKAKK